MYKENDYLVYRKDVCQVKEIKKKFDKDYYVLIPVNDKSLVIEIPADNKMGFIRDVMSREEAENLIQKIPEKEPDII